MRPVLIIFITFNLLQVRANGVFFQEADQFFKTFVNDKGQVDYKGIKKDRVQLDNLNRLIEEFDYVSASLDEQMAFLVNTYNILAIKQVVNLYPIDSPLDNPDFFNGFEHKVSNMTLTLNALEKANLFRHFPDPRLHFVLVCAAKSCPPLANYAYFPDRLEEQVQERTEYVLNLDWFIRVNTIGTELSKIFDWYKEDFEADGMDLVDFVNQYRKNNILRTGLGFYEYDWSLNNQ